MMRLIATMPVRNEAWVLGLTARALLLWVDEIVMLDHASTDETPEIMAMLAREFPGRVHVFREEDPTWFEAAHRQKLLDAARAAGATHIAMVDADEILTGNLLDSIRPLIERMPVGSVFQPPWVCLARSLDRFYAAGPWFNNWVSTAFVDSPAAHWRARDGYDFHHRHPMGVQSSPWRPISQDLGSHAGGLMHLQFISERRLKAKQALYKLTEVERWPGREPVLTVDRRYNLAVYESDPRHIATAACPAIWWAPYGALRSYMTDSEAPWQEAVCRGIVARRPDLANGLDLFGVV